MLAEPTWLEFERGIAGLAEAFGYEGEHTPPSGDFGVDVIARRGDRTVVIQCKLHKVGAIGVGDILKLAGSRQYFEADEAICFSTSGYTLKARATAERLSVHLVDRDGFLTLCAERFITIPALTRLQIGDESWPIFDTCTIGRAQDCDITIDSPFSSRLHVKLYREGLILYAEDCGSSNGTLLNGSSLAEATKLRYFDELSIGGARIGIGFMP